MAESAPAPPGGASLMRILLLHNRYRFEGGEERAVADLVALLRRRGHRVELLERSSAEVTRAAAARALIVGGEDPAAVTRAVKLLGADIVHVHNLQPLLGWRALAAARAEGARTILHLHNFRLFCAIAISYRDGAPCFRCRAGNTLPGLRLRCRGAVAEAAAYAAGLRVQQPRIDEYVDHFAVVSEATRARLQELGLRSERTSTLTNFVAEDRFAARSSAGHGGYALVSGRLVEEKGFDTAIAAARAAGVPLIIAGAGPDEARLHGLAAGADVRFTGWLAAAELDELRCGAAVVLVPSRWEEPCPYSVLDAYAAGVPVLASDRGGLPELVVGGAALPAQQLDRWTTELAELWNDADARRERGEQALVHARERFGEQRYYEQLMSVYGSGLS